MSTVVHRSCHLCEASCGVRLTVENGRVVDLRADEADVASRGHLCPKARLLVETQDDPDRLRAPLRRTARGWEPVGWDEALEAIAARLVEIQRAHGRDAVASYLGNPVGQSFGAGFASQLLLRAIGSHNRFSSGSVDHHPRLAASHFLYGNVAAVPVPDLDRTHFLVVLGANPVVSQGSLMTAPGARRRLEALKRRGGRLVVVDPVRTATAELADTHLAVRPGSDAFLLASLLHLALERPVTPHPALDDLEWLRATVRPFTPEATAVHTGLAAAQVRALARDFIAAPSGVLYARLGTCLQPFATLTSVLLDLVHAVLGRLDVPGGAGFATPAIDLVEAAERTGRRGSFATFKSRVRGAPEFNGELPAACFAEEALTKGPGQVRALVTVAANPALSAPDGPAVARALAGLELLVAVDLYLNETTRHAHFILPPTWSLETDTYAAIPLQVAVRDTARFSPAALPTPPGARHDWQILNGLAARLLAHRAGAAALSTAAGRAAELGPSPRRLIDAALRLGPRRLSLAALEAAPHGLDFGPLAPRLPRLLRRRRLTARQPVLEGELARLRRALAAPPRNDALVLVGRRTLRSLNSWGHNAEALVKGPVACTLQMHPTDAAERGLSHGARVVVRTSVGQVCAPLELTDALARGVVSLPHGWGHHRPGTRLSVASRHPGVSVNDLTSGAELDPIAGTPVLNGVPVAVRLASAEEAQEVERASEEEVSRARR